MSELGEKNALHDEENTFLKRVFESINAAVYIINEKNKISWANSKLKVITGFSLQEINEMGFLDYCQKYFHPEDVDLYFECTSHVKDKPGDDFNGIFRLIDKEGILKRIVFSARITQRFPDRSFKEAILCAIEIPEDFNTEKQVEMILKENIRAIQNNLIQNLTPREKEVFYCITDGLSTKEISVDLGISFHTVESHRKNIFRKLKVNSTPALINLTKANYL